MLLMNCQWHYLKTKQDTDTHTQKPQIAKHLKLTGQNPPVVDLFTAFAPHVSFHPLSGRKFWSFIIATSTLLRVLFRPHSWKGLKEIHFPHPTPQTNYRSFCRIRVRLEFFMKRTFFKKLLPHRILFSSLLYRALE